MANLANAVSTFVVGYIPSGGAVFGPMSLSRALPPFPANLVFPNPFIRPIFSRPFPPSDTIRIVQTYDILMTTILVGAMLLGAIKGFAWQLASIASIVASYAVAYHYREPFSQNIQWDPPWNRFMAMLILYVGTSLVIWVVFRMLGGLIDRMRLKEFDRQIGALFGLAKGALVCVLITLFAVTLLGESVRTAIVGSRSGHLIARVLDQTDIVMPPELQSVVEPMLRRFEEKLKSDASPSNTWSVPGQSALSSPSTWSSANVPPTPNWGAVGEALPTWQSPPDHTPPPVWQQAVQTPPWAR